MKSKISKLDKELKKQKLNCGIQSAVIVGLSAVALSLMVSIIATR